MKHYYCSTFSKEYAYKGLLLYNSIEQHDKDFQFFMICLHDEAKKLFEKMNLAHATIISMENIENEDSELLSVKSSRNVKEYIWTSKASVCLYLFKNFVKIDHIIWLDGDTYFFSDPESIFTEWGKFSVMLTSEKWLDEHSILGETNGIYNTGFMGFKRDEHSMECLHWFRQKLIEWCFDRWEKGLWSDQVYANDWPDRFQNVGILENIGVNLTPYIINYRLKEGTVKKTDNDIFINNEKLVFFHFYGFKYYDGNVFDICNYVMNCRDVVIKDIYLPYLHASKEITDKIKTVDSNFTPERNIKDSHIRNYFNFKVNLSAENEKVNLCTIINKDCLEQGLALYNSLMKHTPNFQLWICCTDEMAYSLIKKMNLDHAILINLKNLEGKELLSIKDTRNPDEYLRTLKPSFISYIFKNNFHVDSMVYTDVDMTFSPDFNNLIDELKQDTSLLIFKRSVSTEEEKKYGVYDAGLIGFNRDDTSLECLYKWKKDCINWCFNKVEEDRWLDQRYLEQWPQLFSGVKVMESPGRTANPKK
ncbi:glycosyl transferase [Bacillus sp. 1NLA3E]|uniref:glycosyl transferase n=1 Tax=Bacillus sp. 1NLA3E TaxID=666686 RepID=UPI000247EE62|nr:glycosyl transferase [Bacillus sp. 1NLA3E]AGK53554.1 putative Glycosyltransferase [Bacillus sp. 1NLA3E]